MKDFLTSKDYHTLEDIAIEVGLNKLCWTGTLAIWKLNHSIVNKKEKKRIIVAAFPFNVYNKNTDSIWPITHITGKRMRRWRYPGDLNGFDGIHSNWQLTNPRLASSTMVRPPDPCTGCDLTDPHHACEKCDINGGFANSESSSPDANIDKAESKCTCGAVKCGLPFHFEWCDGK